MATHEEMKNLFEGKGKSNIYVVNLRKEIDEIKDSKRKHSTWKPPKKWQENPEGYVYVGQTNLTPLERLKAHIRNHKAGKGYVRDYHQPLTMKEEEIICMREGVFDYYEKYMSPKNFKLKFIQALNQKNQEIICCDDHRSVEKMSNN